MKQKALLNELENYVNLHLEFASKLKNNEETDLTVIPENGGWNVLQCIQHLNLYGEIYLKEFSNRFKKASKISIDLDFKPSIFHQFLVKPMLPKQGMMKMKTFASKNPSVQGLTVQAIDLFIEQLNQFKGILSQAQQINLNKNNCKTTLPILKMNFGSTLAFVIYHNERHVQQARALLR